MFFRTNEDRRVDAALRRPYPVLVLLVRTLFVLVLALAACGDDGSPPGDGGGVDGGGPDDGGADAGVDAGPTRRVLFVGNSYTYYNDLPEVVRQLGAVTPGGAVEVESITPGGATLGDHWMTTGARDAIEMGGHDVVVLQAQSLEWMNAKSFFGYGMLLSDAVETAGGRTLWYATWARREGDPVYTDFGLMNPEYMTRRIEQVYELYATMFGDDVARVGAAWQIALTEMPELVLHEPDGSHPLAAGTFLAACVIVQALTGETPGVPDPPPLGLPPELARALCAIAPRVRCLSTMEHCGGECVDVQYNPEHCGGCDLACAGEDPCYARVCGCSEGLTGCDHRCVDLQTDETTCGDCDTSCAVGELCRGGDCVCPAGLPRPITYEELAALRPACATREDAGSLDCNAAAHALCAPLGCHDSGFGPPSGHAPTVEAVMCVPGDVRTTTYTALAAFVPACDGVTERLGQSCTTAIHRYCVSTGATSGFGPIESSGDGLTVTCIPGGTRVPTTYDALQAHASRCFPDPVTCGIAAWNFCEAMGHAGGFGPVEVTGDARDVICFDR
jgi:hypothetical protein